MKLLDKDGLTYYTGKVKSTLTNYVQFTDYATSSVGGVIKLGNGTNTSSGGVIQATTFSYSDYTATGNNRFISKGTLENVITGKDLTTKAYVDGLVGDIDTLLTTLNSGNGV